MQFREKLLHSSKNHHNSALYTKEYVTWNKNSTAHPVTYPLGLPVSLSVITRAPVQFGKAPLRESLSVLYDKPMQIKVLDGVLLPRPLPEPPPRGDFPCPLLLGEGLASAMFILSVLPSSSEPSSSSPCCTSTGLPKST